MNKIPSKKLRNGFEMPVYSMGLWQVGGLLEADSSRDNMEIEAIRFAIERGVTSFDTAEIYGKGHTEEILGHGIKGYDRTKLFISTKVAGKNQSYEGIYKSLEASLKRLGTDYVDLYILHRFPELGLPIENTMRAIDELVNSGKIRNIGVSNMTPERLERTQASTKNKIVYNQVHYNVQCREIEKYGMLEHAVERDYFLAAWRPLQLGLLPQSQIIKTIAKKYNKSSAQIAINWLVSQTNVITLSKTASKKHLLENLDALDFVLDKDEMTLITDHYENRTFTSDVIPLTYQGSDYEQ